MKKFLLSFSVIGMFILYSVNLKAEQSRYQIVSPPSLQNPTINLPASPTPSSSSSTPPPILQTQTPVPTQATGAYKNGSYTGSVEDAFYGNIQVKATISGGKITDVQFLQYPNDRSTSRMINSQAMPYLKQEAIQAQSAQVDIVSGATDSSMAFVQSLSNALAQAKL